MAHIAKRATKRGVHYDVRYPAPTPGQRYSVHLMRNLG